MSRDAAYTYVLRMRAEGRSDDDIREAFRTSGWADADIDALLASMSAAPKPPEDASTSGTDAPAPTWVRDMGWCWGACGLTWIWGIANSVWIALFALLAIVPIVGWLFFLGLAIWLGINGHALAWQHRRFASPEEYRVTMRAWNNGGAIFAIVLLVGGFLAPIPAAIVFPVFARAREKARQVSCESNLKQIGLAALMYAQDHDQRLPFTPTARTLLNPYIKNDLIWQCPSNQGGGYAMNPTLSGANLATVAQPSETVLFYEVDASGQPIFPHNEGADVCFVDGHVKWFNQENARSLYSRMGVATPQALPMPVPQSVPQSAPQPSPSALPPGLIPAFGHARDKALASSCESNMKQLALAELMYVQDYDEHFPRSGEFRPLIFPYVKNDKVFQCPAGGAYAMNAKLTGRTSKSVASPSTTILLYEVDASGKPAYRHFGSMVFAFVDGHTKLSTPEEARAFTW